MNPYYFISYDSETEYWHASWAMGSSQQPKRLDLDSMGWVSWINTGLTGTWRTKDIEAVRAAVESGWSIRESDAKRLAD